MTEHTRFLNSRSFFVVSTVIVATIIIFLVMSVLDEFKFAGERLGVNIAPHDHGILISEVNPGMAAEAAGIQPGDILVGAVGQEIDDVLSLNEALSQRPDRHSPIEIVVLRDEQEIDLQLVPGAPVDVATLLAQLILVGAYLGLAILVARYRHRDLRARLLMLFVTLVAIELAMPVGYTFSLNYYYGMILFFSMATGVQIGLELHLVSLIPERLRVLKRHPIIVPVFYLVGIAVGLGMCLLAIHQWFIVGLFSSPLMASTEGIVLASWAVVVASILIWQVRRARSPRDRNQALLILIGLTPWAIYTLLGQFWPAWEEVSFVWRQQLQNFVLLFFPAAVFVAIFRYGLFDVEHVVRRSLVYGVISAFVIILVYALLTTALPWFSEQVGEDNALWLVTGVAIVTGVLFRPLRGGIERLVERGLFPERRALRQRLIQIASALSSEEHMKDLVQRLADETRQALDLTWVTVVAIDGPGRDLHTAFSEGISLDDHKTLVGLLSSDSVTFDRLSRNQRPVTIRKLARHHAEAARELSQVGAEVLAPLYFQRRMIGIICLSSKRNGELFQREEIELLDLFSHQIAASFENLRLFQDATYEGLTGLLRREAVLRQLDKEFERATINQTSLSVFMIDLDRFKVLNDAHGHLFGDQVLEQVARVMQKSVRAVDSLGRYGGEEFLLVLPDTDIAGAERVAEKIRSAVEELEFSLPKGTATTKITVSIGITGVDPDLGYPDQGARALIAAADQALYKAKQKGRNQAVVKYWTTEEV